MQHMMAAPVRPSASAVSELLAVLELVKNPKDVAAVTKELKADLDALSAKVSENAAMVADIASREASLAARTATVNVLEDEARTTLERAKALKSEYETKVATLRSVLN